MTWWGPVRWSPVLLLIQSWHIPDMEMQKTVYWLALQPLWVKNMIFCHCDCLMHNIHQNDKRLRAKQMYFILWLVPSETQCALAGALLKAVQCALYGLSSAFNQFLVHCGLYKLLKAEQMCNMCAFVHSDHCIGLGAQISTLWGGYNLCHLQ